MFGSIYHISNYLANVCLPSKIQISEEKEYVHSFPVAFSEADFKDRFYRDLQLGPAREAQALETGPEIPFELAFSSEHLGNHGVVDSYFHLVGR